MNVVEGDRKTPFSLDAILWCWGGRFSFPWIAPLTLDPYLIMLSVKQRGIKYYFLSLWYDSTWNWTPVSRTIGEFYQLGQWTGQLCNETDLVQICTINFIWFALVYLFNGLSTPYGVFNGKIWFFRKCFIVIIPRFLMFHCIFFSFVFIWFGVFLYLMISQIFVVYLIPKPFL